MDPSLSEMVTDGANRVGARSEPTPLLSFAFVIAVGACAVSFRIRTRRGVLAAAAVATATLAIPGLSTILEHRRDAPARAESSSAIIERLSERVERFSTAHGCARVTHSECVACEPVVDFALATSVACPSPAPIVLGPDALTATCLESNGTLSCGERGGR
jgi:hypothetical protein